MAKKASDVNFIKHLLTISEKFIDDQRLSPLHISLYYALFHSWNLSMFRNPISVCREELMRASKIGSANTYTKCLKELDAWAYIKYLPSHNPHKGSHIYLYTFNKTNNNGIDISTDKSSDRTNTKGSVKALIPSINSSNIENISKPNKHEYTRSKNSERSGSVHSSKAVSGSKEKSSGKKEKKRVVPLTEEVSRSDEGGKTRFTRPLLSEVRTWFIENKWPILEAEKFFNHYQSNGWLVGGKTAMQNWRASTKKWILNAGKFDNSKISNGRLNATTDKNYNEPL
jgi:hypothetical protein